ncbi:NAD-dependent epimerase/dehydratase family protein [Actinokineospora bangkokensis]|uniref:NAD-dependent epimerase/dehydratase domain-containing protein n=1 Tax=Actinokineospora bangkokensis TaxID=1193682 RepID=A0A1Q9LPA8_9PSEU|nr:NAD-dependent epimerase/dehydratase family protein [Actinokineospora bangkokensis]OLR93860.1 hypothetical protein BJP25_16700 [Actinokineospora bangkokensis]
MRIIGNGFLARHLSTLVDRHPGAVVLAAGVSLVSTGDHDAAFARERALVAETARRCRERGEVLVLLSTASAAVYGTPGCLGEEECAHEGTTPYGRHKRDMERVVRESGCRWLVLRLTHLVGPDQPAHQLVPTLIRDARSGVVRVFTRARRDLMDVQDFLAALDALLAAGVTGEVVNVASGVSVPVLDVVQHVTGLLGVVPQFDLVDRRSDHVVRVSRLRELTGRAELGALGYRDVLDRYVPVLDAQQGQFVR